MEQLHKRFTDEQVKELLKRYVSKEIEREYIQQILGIKRRRFFCLVKQYTDNPASFSIKYSRTGHTRSIEPAIEKNILKELAIDKKLIEDKKVPLKYYNYSYIQTRLEDDYKQTVSLPTIIGRAKKNDFYIPRKPSKKLHDREVLTNHVGELIQHDSSHHLFSPYSGEKWYLITSIDDYSRFMFYAKLLRHESSWVHIAALESVFLKHGFPYSYYVDSHSIFRFVRGRDELHYQHHLQTDETNPQWKQVLLDCNVEVKYALSPQAKGKVERPYTWIQDRLVRTCARENATEVKQGQRILDAEMHRYNFRQIHSTTGEIPYARYQRALKEKLSLFRKFSIKPPFLSTKDIFCLRLERTADAYRRISINNIFLKVNNLAPYQCVNLRIYPLNSLFSEVRFWANNVLLDVQKLKNDVFKKVHF
jgi:hypothetical protein